MVLLTPIKKFVWAGNVICLGRGKDWQSWSASFCFKWVRYKYRSFGKLPRVCCIGIAITIGLWSLFILIDKVIEFGQLDPFPFLGDNRGAPCLPGKQQRSSTGWHTAISRVLSGTVWTILSIHHLPSPSDCRNYSCELLFRRDSSRDARMISLHTMDVTETQPECCTPLLSWSKQKVRDDECSPQLS